jgi:hypothetical protein
MVVTWMVSRRKIVVYVLILIVALAAVSFVYQKSKLPASTPIPNYFIHTNPHSFSVPQGSTITVNITVNSILDKEMSITFGNLTIENLMGINLSPIENQRHIFNFTFNPEPLIVAANASSTGFLTVTFAKDAPTGQFQMDYYVKSDGHFPTGSSFLLNITQAL